MTFVVPFPRFSGQEFWVIRFGGNRKVEGVFTYDEPEIIRFPGQIQPSKSTQNIKTAFGEDVSGNIYITTPLEYPLFIDTKEHENDYIFYRNSFWKVESSIQYDRIVGHNEARASIITNPEEDLTEYAPYYLQVNDDGDVLIDGNCDRIIFGLSDC